MRFWATILVLCLAGTAFGQSATFVPTSATVPTDKALERQNRVAAAVENAVTSMYEDVSRQPIFGKVTVGDLVFRTDGREALMATLRSADQIGGPRWIDEQTVQVRLSLEGPALATSLIEIATNAKDRSPIKPEELAPLVVNWGKRTFSAVGISSQPMSTTRLEIVVKHVGGPATQPVSLPMNAPRWSTQVIQADGHARAGVTRLRAARAAEVDALAVLRKQVDALQLPAGTVGDVAKADPQVNAAIDRAVQRAKLTKVDYLADGGANVRASLDLADLWREVDAARQSTIPVFSPR